MENDNKMSLKEAIDYIVSEIEPLISEYSVEWHDLDKYRGMEFKDSEGNDINDAEYQQVNMIINNIQALFYDLHPVLHFINSRHLFAKNMVASYNQLMQSLVDNGAEVQHIDQEVN